MSKDINDLLTRIERIQEQMIESPLSEEEISEVMSLLGQVESNLDELEGLYEQEIPEYVRFSKKDDTDE